MMKVLVKLFLFLMFANNIYSQEINLCKDRILVIEKKLDSVFYGLIFETSVRKGDSSIKYKDLLCQLIEIESIADSIIVIEHYNFNTERIINNVYFIKFLEGSIEVCKYTFDESEFWPVESLDSISELLINASKVYSIFDIKIITIINKESFNVTVFKGDK